MDSFFNWTTLASLAGATAAVGIITQFIKGIPSLVKIPTQAVSYILSVIILAAATAFTGGADVGAWAIIPLNAVIVSTSANGMYSAVQRVIGGNVNSGNGESK